MSLMRRFFSSSRSAEKVVEVLYDGSCGLCRREISLLRQTRVGRDSSRTKFIDIANRDFNLEEKMVDWKGQVKSVDQLLSEMHVFDVTNGVMHTRVAAFRHLYLHLGAPSFLVHWTTIPPFDSLMDSSYTLFLRYIRPVLSRVVS